MPSHPVSWGSAPGLGSQCLQAQHWRGAHGSGSWEGAERRGNGNARHPPPEEASQLLCGGGSRAQTQTDRFKHTQTDSDTHRNPHAQWALPFPWGTHHPPRTTPLPPCGSHPRPALTQPGTWAVPPHPPPFHRRDEFTDVASLVLGHCTIPGEGHPERPGGSLPLEARGEAGLPGLAREKRRGPEERRLEGVSTGHDLGHVGIGSPAFRLPPEAGSVEGRLVGVVYMTELLTLPSSPGSPEGWPGPACAWGIHHGGSNPECSPKAPGPILLILGWLRDADRGQGVPMVPHLCPLAAEACGRVQGEIPAAQGLEEAGQAGVGVRGVGA